MNSKYTCSYEGKLQSNLTTDLNCQRHISLATIVTYVDVKKINIVSARATEQTFIRIQRYLQNLVLYWFRATQNIKTFNTIVN